MNRELLEEKLSELPLYIYDFIDPKELEFNSRIRWICENECPMVQALVPVCFYSVNIKNPSVPTNRDDHY